MKIAGIIAEYNPFHPGHQFHIEETRRLTGADRVIVVMSGNFVQRGEPAIADKKLRAQSALAGGADLVLELPGYYATASAEYFATAGVKILNSLGCVDLLSFGAETDDLNALERIADLLIREPHEYQELLKKHLKEGCPFPEAREKALLACPGTNDLPKGILKTPNNILAIEYLKAMRREHASMIPLVIRRMGSDYHETDLKPDAFPSATALRNAILQGKYPVIPADEALHDSWGKKNYVVWDDLIPYLGYIHTTDPERIHRTFGMDTDMGNRTIKALDQLASTGYHVSYDQLVSMIHSRSFTDTAVKRALLHLVLGLEKKDIPKAAVQIELPYAKILGFRKSSSDLLKTIQDTTSIDIIHTTGEGLSLYTPESPAGRMFEADLAMTRLYRRIASRKSGLENKEEMIIL